MRSKELKSALMAVTRFLFVLGIMSIFHGTALAQSSFERSFVPKAKLVDTFWTKRDNSSGITVDHSAWSNFLATYVRTDGEGINRVAYAAVDKAGKKQLVDYIRSLEAVDVTKLNGNEQFAYWVNLYNAATVNIVVDNFPINSIRDVKKNALDISGPFNDKVVTVAGKQLTLNEIESGIVRPLWKDARLHYAFNCAAVTCPNLLKTAFTGATLNEQLDGAARNYINNPRAISFDGSKSVVSKIYFWYQGDFGGSDAAIIKHMIKFADAELAEKLRGIQKIDSFVYDWSLNAAK